MSANSLNNCGVPKKCQLWGPQYCQQQLAGPDVSLVWQAVPAKCGRHGGGAAADRGYIFTSRLAGRPEALQVRYPGTLVSKCYPGRNAYRHCAMPHHE